MKIRLTVIGFALASLTACATQPGLADAFLEPCVIEGRHPSFDALLDDPESTNQDLINFAGHADDAVRRCNADKAAARRVLNGETE